MADDSKTIKIPLFDGKSKNFVMWWIRFKAYAKVMGFHQALNVDPEPALPVTQKDAEQLDPKEARNKNAIDAMNRNDKALSNLAVPLRQWYIYTRWEALSGQTGWQVTWSRV
jgi:hypothetical protein